MSDGNYDGNLVLKLLLDEQYVGLNEWDEADIKDAAYAGFNLAAVLANLAKRMVNDDGKKHAMLICTVGALRGPRACYTGSITNKKLNPKIQSKCVDALMFFGIKDDYLMKTSGLKSDELSPQRVMTCLPHLVAIAILQSWKLGIPKLSIGNALDVSVAKQAGVPLYLIHPFMAPLLTQSELPGYISWVERTSGAVSSGANKSVDNPGALARLSWEQRASYGANYSTKARDLVNAQAMKVNQYLAAQGKSTIMW